MAWDDLARDSDRENMKGRDRLVAVFIGVLAVVLALCSLGGQNAAQDAMLNNIQASNTWAFFQAKNARRQALRLHVDEFEVMLKSTTLSDDVRALIEGKVAEYHKQEKHLTSEPETKEGLDELFVRGKALEADRDEALKRGPYFDYGQALLQIAIVLASVAIISGGNLILIASMLVGLMGSVLTVGGFTLAFPIPFLG